MSENQNCGLRDFSEYDSMTTEELEEILRLDAETPVGYESDEELLFYVMGVLADRRNNTEFTGKTAFEAYESFKQHYLPMEEKIESTPVVSGREKRHTIRWMSGMAAAAAALVIVFGSMTVNAMGFNIWETVVTWAQETFCFGDGNQSTANSDSEMPYDSLQEALLATNRDPTVIPTWLPDGYELSRIAITEDPMRKKYVAIYKNGERHLKIVVQSYLDNDPEQIEQSDGFLEKYEVSGIAYYIFSDISQMRAAWINGSYECYVSGELTINQIKCMIDSIGKGES